MPKNLKELLHLVFSCDTKAGYRLRYHIVRALACKDYKEKIAFSEKECRLISLFVWEDTSEGQSYWGKINLLSY